MFAFTTFTSDPPVTSRPVGFGPTPPPTKVSGASLSPMATPLEPPVTRMPTASPEVRLTPWALIPLTVEFVTPLTVTAGVVPLPNTVVTSDGPKSLKSWVQPPLISMFEARVIGAL